MRTTSIRFTGLASGLDTDSMVEAMMMPYKNKVDIAVQQQKLLELKKDAWKEMNTKILSFQQNTLNALRLQGSFNKNELTLSSTGYVEVDGTSSLPEGTHKVTVNSLAEGSRVTTTNINAPDGVTLSKDTKLTELGISEDAVFEIKVGDKTISLPAKVAIADTDPAEYKEATIGDLEKAFNDAGVSAKFDANAGAFFIASKGTGSSQSIEINVTGADQADTMSKLGIISNDGSYNYSGKDASITYNGIEVKSQTNSVTVNGMTLKLVGADPTKEITIVSKKDTGATVDMLKSFVDEYNALIDNIYGKINAAYNKDYKPLTDEQKASMTEEDIKLWNAKVEASVLRKDPVLQAVVDSMRDIISNTSIEVDGKKYSLASFGITTTGNYKEYGKLAINEDKLTEMVNSHPEVLTELFTTREGNGGIGTQLYDDLNKKLMSDKVGSMSSSNFLFNDKELDKKIRDQEDKIAKLEERMNSMENIYYKKYAAMEQMISTLNNQSSSLMSTFGGM
ncbi:MAG: flagellar filament capping protein FliD [Cellulosilyticaceae bacterium]